MKTKNVAVFLLLGLLISLSTLSQHYSTNKTLVDLLEKAKLENKKLFLVFGWEACGWCRVYDKYHDDKVIRNILGQHFSIIKMDISKTKDGKDLFKLFGKGGTPSWTIFNEAGGVLIDSHNGEGNIGFPASKKELDYYLAAIKTAVPEFSDQNGEILISKLKEYRKRKSQGEFKN